jgi:hypothetical protein
MIVEYSLFRFASSPDQAYPASDAAGGVAGGIGLNWDMAGHSARSHPQTGRCAARDGRQGHDRVSGPACSGTCRRWTWPHPSAHEDDESEIQARNQQSAVCSLVLKVFKWLAPGLGGARARPPPPPASLRSLRGEYYRILLLVRSRQLSSMSNPLPSRVESFSALGGCPPQLRSRCRASFRQAAANQVVALSGRVRADSTRRTHLTGRAARWLFRTQLGLKLPAGSPARVADRS